MGVQVLKKYSRCAIIFTATAIVTAIILLLILYKPPIETASINDLKDIDGIGVYKAGAIVEYITYYPNADIEDLDDIDGIGEKTVEKIKEEYR